MKASPEALSSLISKLKAIPVDTSEEYLHLIKSDFIIILKDFLNGNISQNEIEELVDLLEANDGIVFEDDQLKESIHLISNYRINGISLHEQCKRVCTNLEGSLGN